MEVFNFAVSKKCKKLILCHNHPSNSVDPSGEDIALTKRLEEGAKVLNIELLDHIIICEKKNFYSMADNDEL